MLKEDSMAMHCKQHQQMVMRCCWALVRLGTKAVTTVATRAVTSLLSIPKQYIAA